VSTFPYSVRTRAYELVACVSKLEVRGRWTEFVYKLVDHTGEPSVLVTLKVGFQIILCKTFVDLFRLQIKIRDNRLE
jgi:hypothetical protein